MADQRIRLLADLWYELNKALYGHTPFWTRKEPKLIQQILKQMDSKQLDHKLTFDAVRFYFKQEGFEKTVKAHDFVFFYSNYQKYLQAVMPSTAKKYAPPPPDKKVDPDSLRKFIKSQGQDYIKKLKENKSFTPANLYWKSVQICIELFGQDKCKSLTPGAVSKPSGTDQRKKELMEQAKKIRDNV